MLHANLHRAQHAVVLVICSKPHWMQEHHELLDEDASCMDALRNFFSGRALDRLVLILSVVCFLAWPNF